MSNNVEQNKNNAETNALVPAMCNAGSDMLKSIDGFRFPEVIRDLMGTYGYLPAHKPEGAPKNAFNAALGEIPAELLESKTVQKIDDDKLALVCEEGDQLVSIDSVIGWGPSELTRTKFNCWCIGNAWKSLKHIGKGRYVTSKMGLVLYPVTDILPAVLENCGIEQDENSDWTFPYKWGVNGRQTAFVGRGFWVVDGVDDETGKPEFHYLGGGSAGSDQTILCEMDGNEYGADICTIADLYPTVN